MAHSFTPRVPASPTRKLPCSAVRQALPPLLSPRSPRSTGSRSSRPTADVVPTPDDRAPLAIAAQWATVAITVALEMAVPALIGFGIDSWLGTRPVLVSIGAVLGLVLGMWHLVRLSNSGRLGQSDDRHRRRS